MNLGTKIAIGSSIILIITGIVLAIVFTKSGTKTVTKPVDCVVGNWSDWSTCDKECGPGYQTRNRQIITQPSGSGLTCPNLIEKKSCKIAECPVDCVVSNWSNWSTCDKECGTGSQTRNREINILPSNGGLTCPNLTEKQSCIIKECPVDCVYGEWSDWSRCDSICGPGNRTRTRDIIVYGNYGGKKCDEPLIIKESCDNLPCKQILYPSADIVKKYFDTYLAGKFTNLGDRYSFNVSDITLTDPRSSPLSEINITFGDKKYNIYYIISTNRIFVQITSGIPPVDLINFGNVIKIGVSGLNQTGYSVEFRSDKYYGYSISEIFVL
jgi:hypothetical protein